MSVRGSGDLGEPGCERRGASLDGNPKRERGRSNELPSLTLRVTEIPLVLLYRNARRQTTVSCCDPSRVEVGVQLKPRVSLTLNPGLIAFTPTGVKINPSQIRVQSVSIRG